MAEWFNSVCEKFMRCFVDNGYWKWLLEGLGKTLIITVFAVLIGFVFGVVLATIRSSYDKNEESLKLIPGEVESRLFPHFCIALDSFTYFF